MEKNSQQNTNSRFTTKQLTMIGVMTAVTCILGPLSIPLSFTPVPISLTNLAVYISIYVLGTKLGTVSYIVYLLLGLVGLPIFSNFTGGLAKLAGPTGGYLIGFIFLAIIGGLFVDHFQGKIYMHAIGLIIGTGICYLFGSLWLAIQAHLTFEAALWAGVIPYIPGDIAKVVIALIIGPQIRKQIRKL